MRPTRSVVAHFLTHRKEEGVEGFAEFCLYFPRILIDAVRDQINML